MNAETAETDRKVWHAMPVDEAFEKLVSSQEGL